MQALESLRNASPILIGVFCIALACLVTILMTRNRKVTIVCMQVLLSVTLIFALYSTIFVLYMGGQPSSTETSTEEAVSGDTSGATDSAAPTTP